MSRAGTVQCGRCRGTGIEPGTVPTMDNVTAPIHQSPEPCGWCAGEGAVEPTGVLTYDPLRGQQVNLGQGELVSDLQAQRDALLAKLRSADERVRELAAALDSLAKLTERVTESAADLIGQLEAVRRTVREEQRRPRKGWGSGR